MGLAAIAHFFGKNEALSYTWGGLLISLNLGLHWLVWGYLIQRKKLIAFAVTLIVFKYAIFGTIIYKVLGLPTAKPLWFCVGVGSLLVSSLLVAVTRKENVV